MEWTVVSVIVVLMSLIGGVVAPVIRLNSSITRLTTVVDGLCKNLDSLTQRNSQAHEKLWGKLEEHGDTINKHEALIQIMAHKQSGGIEHG